MRLEVAGPDVLNDAGIAEPAALCSGDYQLRLTLHDYGADDELLDALASNQTWFHVDEEGNYHDVDEWDIPEVDELPPARLETLVDVRFVPSVNHSSVSTGRYSVELPAYFNASEMTRTSTKVTYVTEERLHSVTTTITTNTTVVPFEWLPVNSSEPFISS